MSDNNSKAENQVIGEAPKQYIGRGAVKEAHRDDNANLVAVKLDDNRRYELSIRQFEAMVSDKPYDEGQVDQRKWAPLVARLLTELLADGMVISEKDTILQLLDNSIVHNYEVAIGKLFGVNHPMQINIKLLDEVLKENSYIAFDKKTKDAEKAE